MTSLRQEFSDGVNEIFSEFGDVVVDGIYISRDSTYVPGTGNTVTEQEYVVGVIIDDNVHDEMIAGVASANQEKAMIPQSELRITPEIEDRIRVGNNIYIVRKFESDPADAMWTFFVEKT